MKYKAVIADVDGTLMEPSEHPCPPPSDKLVEAVKEVTAKGVKFSIATGRSLSWVTEIISAFDLQTPIILDNGARIYDCKFKEYISESLIPKEISQKILLKLNKEKNLEIIVADDGKRLEDLSKIRDWKISKILILGVTPVKAEELYQIFRKIPDIQVTRSVSGIGKTSESVHITNYNATKQAATEKLLEYWQIKKEETIGIGDSYNDVSLLLASGLKVAIGNAIPEIKAIADYIAPSYEDDGVIDVLEKFILKKSQKSKVKSQNYNSKFKINKLHNLSGEEKNQLLVVVDKFGKSLGTATREECHKGEGKPHLAFMAFVVDKNKNIIITRRSGKKSLWGGYWDASVVSHVLAGETPVEASKRRGKEELGINADFQDLGAFYYFAKYRKNCENEYCHVLVGETKEDISPNPVEIEELKRISITDLKKEIKKNSGIFTPWLKLALAKIDI